MITCDICGVKIPHQQIPHTDLYNDLRHYGFHAAGFHDFCSDCHRLLANLTITDALTPLKSTQGDKWRLNRDIRARMDVALRDLAKKEVERIREEREKERGRA